ncbi:glycosyltransferase family 2 protein [Winogradskyella sp. SYSU M77433]|uniref:glycosyltransferase family 2 protein n=1 Tax=Winogradskyella sp. SYSU M77433 TaxID=3042722 RepID=UPI00248046AC|nr:glycosyltransferase family 2 protein [Winogradskyella sp. SYSU M77433]MDH7911516.1 glycosyltransferase family 2 protein [Winogradskyella sp. SYSU M77433]
MNNIKVSIIIPLYNSVSFFEETIKSIIDQSYKNWEIIIVDDGSEDGSYELAKEYASDNIRVVKNRGKGACAARNYGLDLAVGDYIQFLDADDLISEDKIQNQLAQLERNSKSITVCSTKHFYESFHTGKITDRAFLYTTDNPKELLLNLYGADGEHHNMIQTSAWLTPKSLIKDSGPWNEDLSKDQDGEFFCRVATRAEKIIFTPNVFNYYRKHINGKNIANQKKRKHLESQITALESKSAQFKGLETTQAYKNAMALQYKLIAIDAFPEFKDLSSMVLSRSKDLAQIDYLPVLGGNVIEFFKKIFGWKIAKIISYWVHKL